MQNNHNDAFKFADAASIKLRIKPESDRITKVAAADAVATLCLIGGAVAAPFTGGMSLAAGWLFCDDLQKRGQLRTRQNNLSVVKDDTESLNNVRVFLNTLDAAISLSLDQSSQDNLRTTLTDINNNYSGVSYISNSGETRALRNHINNAIKTPNAETLKTAAGFFKKYIENTNNHGKRFFSDTVKNIKPS